MTTIHYDVFSANEWVYPDTLVPEHKQPEVTLIAPCNSYACTQLLLSGAEACHWSFEMETAGINEPELYLLLPVYVEKNTGERGCTLEPGTTADYVTRPAPFWVYDAMEPAGNVLYTPEGFSSLGLYIRWSTRNMKPGQYSCVLRLWSDTQTAVVPIRLTVAAVSVPERETLRLTNWYSLENMADYHGLPRWSDAHWTMMEEYGRRMREGRQTDFLVPADLAQATKGVNGNYTFDFSRTIRFIETYLKLGFSYIEGGTPITRLDWADAHFVIQTQEGPLQALSDEGYAYLSAYFQGWYALLRDRGWLSQTIQHVGDEPHEANAAEFRILSGMVRKWMPGVPLIEAVEIAELDGAVDIWVPKDNTYLQQREKFERKRRLGDVLWFYTCCCPGGWYLNRLLDGALLRVRYLHWANALYGLTGYLHWGLNQYQCTNDPYKGAAGKIDTLSPTSLPCGDTHILYPLGERVLTSVRFEAMRAGCEDYELLYMLQQKDARTADRLIKRCIRSFTDYAEDAEIFSRVYEELLFALSNN